MIGAATNKHTYLDPAIEMVTSRKKGKWTAEEEEAIKLIEAVTKHGSKDWLAVAALVPFRTNAQCRNRWVDIVEPTMDLTTTPNKGTWTGEEDTKLIEAVKENGNDGFAVTALVPSRTRKQCLQKWAKTLDPDINTSKWTLEEDTKLTER
jgi:myb proto-oncogene protein